MSVQARRQEGQRPPAGAYLLVLLAGAVLTLLVLQLFPDWMVGPVQGVALVALAYLIAAVVLWWREPAAGRPAGPLAWFLLSYLLLWIYLMGLLVTRQEGTSVTAIILPLAVALVWFKPLTRASARWVADGLAVVVLAVAAVSVATETLGWVDSWYGLDGAALAADESSRYWIPLGNLLGLDGRWAGPFVHPNLAGPVGAVLLVFGASRRGWRRVLFLAGGVVIVVLASSRTAIVATVAGLLTLVAVWWINRPGALPRSMRATLVAVPAVLMAVVLVVTNPGLTGRTTVWPVMIDLWRAQPIFGIGDAGYRSAIDSGLLFTWADHAHNVFLDALVRTGIVGLVLVLAVMGQALVIAARGTRHSRGVGIALVVTLVVGSLADTILHWRFVEVTSAALLLAVLMSAPDAVAGSPISAPDPSAPAPPPDPAPVPGSDPGPGPAPTP